MTRHRPPSKDPDRPHTAFSFFSLLHPGVIASVEKVDVLVSWNFQQIVNLNRIHAFNAVNLKHGYLILEIRSPREVLSEKEV